eukprot:484846-Prorocentrum_minimum.AAC.6
MPTPLTRVALVAAGGVHRALRGPQRLGGGARRQRGPHRTPGERPQLIGSRRRNIPPPLAQLALVGGISLPPSCDMALVRGVSLPPLRDWLFVGGISLPPSCDWLSRTAGERPQPGAPLPPVGLSAAIKPLLSRSVTEKFNHPPPNIYERQESVRVENCPLSPYQAAPPLESTDAKDASKLRAVH